MADVRAVVLADLVAEWQAVDARVRDLDEDGWRLETPAEGWTVGMQVAHLAWTDEQALLAATDADAFAAAAEALAADGPDAVDRAAAERAEQPPALVLAGWRAGRAALRDALAAHGRDDQLPWYGPPMSATTMATARLMEAWAHGVDIADALGVEVPATDRLQHVAHLAVRTRDFSFRANDLEPPTAPIRVELTAPVAGPWTWGPEDAEQRVTGSAHDFCLLAVQRRHRDDLDVHAEGEDADRWLDVAQAFAGPAGTGRVPRGTG